MEQPAANSRITKDGYRGGAAIGMSPAGMAASLALLLETKLACDALEIPGLSRHR